MCKHFKKYFSSVFLKSNLKFLRSAARRFCDMLEIYEEPIFIWNDQLDKLSFLFLRSSAFIVLFAMRAMGRNLRHQPATYFLREKQRQKYCFLRTNICCCLQYRQNQCNHKKWITFTYNADVSRFRRTGSFNERLRKHNLDWDLLFLEIKGRMKLWSRQLHF